ncbi:MAG: helix-turn-helix transcriptional regulator, partial [Bacteroidales bacterium]
SGVSYKDLVPEEFAQSLPDCITLDYLTNGLFLSRVNKCADGTLISTLIKTEFVYLDHVCHVETTAILNPETIHIGEMRYKQLSEILKFELDLLKNKEMTADSNYINRLLQLQLADYSLTIKEVQFCSLLHSGMHTKEIADVLSLTIESIYSFRKRLRKKLELSAKTDLFTFLQRLTKEN